VRDSLDRSNQAASRDCFGTPGVTPTDGATAARLPRGCSTLAPPTGRSALPLARFTPGASRRAAVSPPSTRLLVLVRSGQHTSVTRIGVEQPRKMVHGERTGAPVSLSTHASRGGHRDSRVARGKRISRTTVTVIVLGVWAVDVRRDRLVIGLAAG
jgi:hypothetical protein